MNRLIRAVAGVCVAAGLMACPPKPAGNCGGTACAATERCDADSLKCVADAAPIITLDSPPVVSTATFTVTGTITDDAQVTSAEWRTGTRPFTSIDLQSGGAFTITVDAPVLDAENIVLTLRASDGKNETTLSRDVKVDRIGPTVELQSPDAGSVHGTATFTVALAVSDGSGALSELSVNGQMVSNPTSGATVMTSVDVPVTANNTLLEVPVVAADSRGNRTTTSFSFYGDRVAPQVAITSPTADQLIATATMTVTFTVSDPSAVTASCANTTFPSVAAMQTGPGTWSCELPVAIEERPETITVVATDAAGNAAMKNVMIRIDRVPPVVTIVAPNAGSIFRASFAVSATAPGAMTVAARLMTGTNVMLTGGPMWGGMVSVPMHDYAAETLVVEATDAAGNVGTATANIFTDTVDPVVTFTAPMANQRFNIASLGANTTVRTTWTVSDADPTAATTNINNTPSTANQFDQPTSATDNPQNYTTAVIAMDRAGNAALASINYSVDRVAPSISTWTPAAGSRLVYPRVSTLTFSEPVTQPANALLVTGAATQPTGAWGGNTFIANLDAFALSAVELTVASSIADLYGNPVTPAPAARRVHLGTGFAPSTNVIIGTGPVADYDVSTDSDGVMTIAAVMRGAVFAGDETLEVYRDTGSALTRVNAPAGFPANIVSAHTTSWNVVGADLSSSNRFGVVVSALFTGTNSRFWSVDGVVSSDSASAPLAVISRPRLGPAGTITPTTPLEPANNAIGGINGSTYSRLNGGSPYTVTLPQPTGAGVVQSNTNWTSFATTASAVTWSRFYCWYGAFVGRMCSSYATSVAAPTTPTDLVTAVTRGGGCMLASWSEGANRRGFAEARPACELATEGCVNDNSTTPANSSSLITAIRPGTWDVPGEDTLLLGRATTGGAQVDRMSGCQFGGSAFATFTTLPGLLTTQTATKVRPVRVGSQVGVLYLDSNSVLRLHVQ